MTLTQFIEHLQALKAELGHGNIEVAVAKQTNNHWRMIAAPIVCEAAVGQVAYSAYLDEDRVLDEDDLEKAEERLREEIANGNAQPGDELLIDNKPIREVVLLEI